MLQTNQKTIKVFDVLILLPFAWVISQAVLTGTWWWMLIAYAVFINYAYWRKERG